MKGHTMGDMADADLDDGMREHLDPQGRTYTEIAGPDGVCNKCGAGGVWSRGYEHPDSVYMHPESGCNQKKAEGCACIAYYGVHNLDCPVKGEKAMANESESVTLAEGFLHQQKRVREVMCNYASIGPARGFGIISIEEVMQRADRAVMEQDTVAMLTIYEELKNIEA